MENLGRREFLKLTSSGLAGLMLPENLSAADLEIIDHPSPRRRTRPIRLSTDYGILHTTEAPGQSSLNSLTRFGNANYMIDTNGDVYRIMGPNQVSTGAGRSMWNGRTNLDNHAANFEFVGYHNQRPTNRQLESGRELISLFRSIRGWMRDQDFMPHSMVAYGAPNRYQRNSHRGRKRCGMLFAQDDIRRELGLGPAPTSDPDVRARRLVVADQYLDDVLFRNGRVLASSTEHPDEPDNIISTIGRGESPWTYAGNEYRDSTTIYFLNNGQVRRGDELRREGFNFDVVQPGTRLAVGYTYGGHVSGERSAYEVAGRSWNFPSTLYRFPNGDIKTGDEVNENSIPGGTLVLFRR